MPVVNDIFQSYLKPRAVFESRLESTASEGRAYAYLLAGCFAHFIARLPGLANTHLFGDSGISFVAASSGNFLGLVVFGPFLFYLLACIANLLARLANRGCSWRNSRVVLFWAFLAVSPLALFNGIASAAIGIEALSWILQAAQGLAFLLFWVLGMSVASTYCKNSEYS